VWLYTSALGSREHEGRTSLQNSEAQHKLSMTFLLLIFASHRSFQPIRRDLESQRKMPNFALSRRQRGFESRWGHKIKPPLTRPDTTNGQPESPRIGRQGRARDAGAPASAAFGRAPDQLIFLGQRWCCECRRTCAVASLDLVLDGKALGALQRITGVSATTKHVRSALRMRDVDRTAAIAGDRPTTHVSATTGRNE
jgi:hypothetical protein